MSKNHEQAIREVIQTWMAATQAGDSDTVLDLMTDDVIFMVPGHEPFGKKAFEEASKIQESIRYETKSDIQEIQINNDWAYVRQHITVKAIQPDEPPIQKSGYTLSIFHKGSDGKWRLARDANLLIDDLAD